MVRANSDGERLRVRGDMHDSREVVYSEDEVMVGRRMDYFQFCLVSTPHSSLASGSNESTRYTVSSSRSLRRSYMSMTMVRVPFWVTVSVKRLTGARIHSSRLAKVGARRGLLPARDNILLHHLVRLIPPLLHELVPLLGLQVGEIEHPLLHHPDRPRPSLAVPPQMGCSNLHRRAALFLGSALLGV